MSHENKTEFNDASSSAKKRRTLEIDYFSARNKYWETFIASSEYARHKRKAEMNIRLEEDGTFSLKTHDGAITIDTRKDDERGSNYQAIDSLTYGSCYSAPTPEQTRRQMVEEYLSYVFCRKYMDRDALTSMLMECAYQKGMRVGASNEKKGFNKPYVWTRIR